MLTSLFVSLPIFALILAGWAARKRGWLGPGASSEVNRLVVWLALPALLFDIMAKAKPEEIWRPDFILGFSLGCAAIFAPVLLVRRLQGKPLPDASIDGLNASYANTGFLGFPLVLAAIGESAMAPTLVATILTVSVLFAVAIVLIEFGVQEDAKPHLILWRTGGRLVRNPLLIAPALGAAAMLAGWAIPAPAERFLDLLGGAASPCALIALGLFLANDPASQGGEARPAATATLVGLKLIAHPLATWAICGPWLGLPQQEVFLAVLLAALPTGTGPFMLAEYYRREARLTGRAVLVSTMLSVGTVSGYLALAG